MQQNLSSPEALSLNSDKHVTKAQLRPASVQRDQPQQVRPDLSL